MKKYVEIHVILFKNWKLLFKCMYQTPFWVRFFFLNNYKSEIIFLVSQGLNYFGVFDFNRVFLHLSSIVLTPDEQRNQTEYSLRMNNSSSPTNQTLQQSNTREKQHSQQIQANPETHNEIKQTHLINVVIATRNSESDSACRRGASLSSSLELAVWVWVGWGWRRKSSDLSSSPGTSLFF